jgi:histidinol-phosphate aminotransferase
MGGHLSRRNWLKSTSLISTGIALGSGGKLMDLATNKRSAFKRASFWEWETTTPKKIDLYNLKARLLANENPYGPSDKTKLAIYDTISMGNRYGHGFADELISLIAEKEGVPEDHIVLGPGSSDLLEKTAVTMFMKGGNIVSADPAYMSIIKSAESMGATWKAIPVKKDWSHDLGAMEAAIDADTKLVYICNPNNPTGTITTAQDLWDFCKRVSNKKLVFVDEAYLEFMEDTEDKKSMVGLLNEKKNVIVARTFSKVHGMAGLRVGYAVGLPETLANIKKVYRSNMGMNITALQGAITSIQDYDFIEKSRKWNKESRDYVCAELKKEGFECLSSQTSFVLFPIQMKGKVFLESMFEKGVGVRSFNIFGQDYCRVSMGTMPEMELFINTLREVLV